MSKSAPAAAEAANCHPSVWRRLNAIVDRRKSAKNREGDLVKHRKEVEGELADCGATPSTRRTKLCVDHWDTISAINHERVRIRTLADLLETSIEEGRQGKLYADDEDIESVIDQAEEEEESPLVKSAREDREAKKSGVATAAAPGPIKNALGQTLEVGRVYRFTSRTDTERWMEGRLERIHAGTSMITVDALAFDPGFGKKAVLGTHDVNTAVLSWVAIDDPDAKPAAEAEPKPATSTARADLAAAIACTVRLEGFDLDGKSARALRDSGFITVGDVAKHFSENVGNCRLTKIGVTGKDELKLENAVREAALGHDPTPADASAPTAAPTAAPAAAPAAAAEPEAKSNGRKPAKPLEEVRDGHGRKKKAAK